MKKTILVITALALLASPRVAFAAQETCVTQYGGGVVCGASTLEVHQPVKAGLGENLALLGGVSTLLSVGLYFYSNRIKVSNA